MQARQLGPELAFFVLRHCRRFIAPQHGHRAVKSQ
jgi:hypothetical protein